MRKKNYTLKEAIQDGIVVAISKDRWKELSGGQPIVATRCVASKIRPAGLIKVWQEYVEWRREREPIAETLDEEEKTFLTKANGETVMIRDDGIAFTLMYPQEWSGAVSVRTIRRRRG